MGQYSSPLPGKTLEKMFSTWMGVIKRKECGSICALPCSDRHYRIQQFINWAHEKNSRLNFITINFRTLASEDWKRQFTKELAKYEKVGKYTVFIISDAEWLLTAAPHFIPKFKEYVLSPYRRTSILFFFELNILDVKYVDLFKSEPLFIENLIYRELYSHNDISHFLHHMSELYGFNPLKEDLSRICEECGGYIWLATEALRHLHQSGTLTFGHPSFRYRLEAIWAGFSESEKQILVKLTRDQEVNLKEVKYFQEIGLITLTTQPQFTVPILGKYIKDLSRKDFQLHINEGKIYLGPTPIQGVFSKQESRFLLFLLNNQGKFLSRETIAYAVWDKGSNTEYSDWGLDQVVRRVRKRLSSVGVDPTFIKVVRGKGILLESLCM